MPHTQFAGRGSLNRPVHDRPANPFGIDAGPVNKHERHMNPLIADDITFALQAALVIIGFYYQIQEII